MATQKPISTISYNTESFLKEKLDGWVKAHIIQCYTYICHKGEDGDKDHIHLRIEPNKKLDPMDLSDLLQEYQIGKDKPLGVRPWRPSSEEDWFMYVVHDPRYLSLKYSGGDKGEKIPYKWQDIKASEGYDVEVAFIRARSKIEHTTANIATRLRSGEDPISLILSGENVYTVNALMKALSNNDYTQLLSDFATLRAKYDSLVQAVYDYGLAIECNEEGKIILCLPSSSDPAN